MVPVEDPRHEELCHLHRLFSSSCLKGSSDLLSRRPLPPSQGAVSAAEGVYGSTRVPRWAGAAERWTPSPLVEDLKVKQPFVSTAQPQLVHWPYLFLLRQWRDGRVEFNGLCFPPLLERVSPRSLSFTTLLFLCDVSAWYSAQAEECRVCGL